MDIDLFYTEQGTGFPFIFLHGNGEDHTYFEHQIAYFSGFYRVIAIDTRGHGRSPRGKTEFTIAQFAEDLHDFMLQKGIKKAILLGFSDGGNIALSFAVKYSDMLAALIVNGANVKTRGVKASIQLPVMIKYHKLLFDKSMEKQRDKELLGLLAKNLSISGSDLQRLKVPTLVIAGTEDLIKKSHTKWIARHIPDAQLDFLPGDHGVAHDNSECFNQTVHVFLRRSGL